MELLFFIVPNIDLTIHFLLATIFVFIYLGSGQKKAPRIHGHRAGLWLC